MRFDDEPVPGYPLPILPGHTSPGRLERVLRSGGFAITAELEPPDSADPSEGRKRGQLPYVQSGRVRLVDARRLCPRHANFLPRQKPNCDSG